MKTCGMIRLSEIDQRKLGKSLMMLSLLDLSKKVSKIYFLQIGNIDSDILYFIKKLNVPFKITKTEIDYHSGWFFKNNESLQELYESVNDEYYDWIIYSDIDDLLPDNINYILNQADLENKQLINFPFIESLGSIDKIIKVDSGYSIGPHYKAVKHIKNLTFIDSEGFNEPKTILPKFNTNYCIRHIRYGSKEAIDARKNMNYYQDFFTKNHILIDFVEGETFNYYKK